MAGNPLARFLPYIKKYAAELFIGIGVFAYIKRHRTNDYTYRSVYSKNDYERRRALEDLREYLSHH